MIIHLGKLSIQTDNITYVAHANDGSSTIFFVGDSKLDLTPESSRMLFKHIDGVDNTDSANSES